MKLTKREVLSIIILPRNCTYSNSRHCGSKNINLHTKHIETIRVNKEHIEKVCYSKNRPPFRPFDHRTPGSLAWNVKLPKPWSTNHPLPRRRESYGKNRGKTPKWMVKIMENPIKIYDLGVRLFLETPMLVCVFGCFLKNKPIGIPVLTCVLKFDGWKMVISF